MSPQRSHIDRRAESGRGVSGAPLDVAALRAQFPILGTELYGHPLAYLDSAASAQKPNAVLDAMRDLYTKDYSNVHRGVHTLSQRATQACEDARERVRKFIGAAETREVILVRGTTEAINLVASSYAGSVLRAGDEILLTELEHHSNIVPWQLVAKRTHARVRAIPIDGSGDLDLEAFERMLGAQTRIVALTHLSNVLGTLPPLRKLIDRAHSYGAVVLVDGAQAVPHLPVDVQSLDCDFYAFSAHKMYGPTGVGVLYGKARHLEAMPPYHGGGNMIRTVTIEESTWNELPWKFEAGTPDIAGCVGLGAAVDFLDALDRTQVQEHERRLLDHAVEELGALPGVEIHGRPRERAGAISFAVADIHPHDVGTVLDRLGIAVRAGHHCAQPLIRRLGVSATVRASFALYNTLEEVDRLAAGIRETQRLFGV